MARMGGAAYDAATKKIRDGQIKKGRIKFVKADAALMKRYERDSKAIHEWWINKTRNGRAVFDLYKNTLEDLRG